MIPVALLFMALGGTAARADTIVASGGNVTAINGIAINGSTYNLTFTTTALTPYTGDPTNISGVESQLIADLAGYPTVGNSDAVLILYTTGGFDDAIYNGSIPVSWVSDNSSTICTPGTSLCGSIYADFTAVATPEPGTALLTMLGLGILGLVVVLRKRVGLRQPQAT
jgi:hypothetical protein